MGGSEMNSFLAQLIQDPTTALLIVVKILILIILAIYLAFPILAIRQLKAMEKIMGFYIFDLPLRIFTWVFLAVSIFIFFLAAVIL